MSFDKAAYWAKRNGVKMLGKANLSTRIVCRRCKGGDGQLIKDTFFCRKGCDQNSLWDRIVGFFGFGNWRVIYPDGNRSEPMSRRVAASYRFHFGGLLLRTSAAIRNPGLS